MPPKKAAASKVTKPKSSAKAAPASEPILTKQSKAQQNKADEAQADLEKLSLKAKATLKAKPAPKAQAASKEPVSKKRARTSEPADEPADAPTAAKRPKIAAKAPKAPKIEPILNEAPTQILDVYVFGSGENGELGLGHERRNGKKPKDVSRPRLNDLIGASNVGVVEIAVGGMHCMALSHDNKLYTWGVNDHGALGRDTNPSAAEKAAKEKEAEDSDSDDDDMDLNAKESTPVAIPSDAFPAGTKFTQVVACDSSSFVLTSTGTVYGWGTFSGSDGVIGFSKNGILAAEKDESRKKDIVRSPVLIPDLKKIKKLAAGQNHVIALDHQGNVFAWGCAEQNQLGRRMISGHRENYMVPSQFGLPKRKVTDIFAGAYHSFAIDQAGKVYTWGLNNFGQAGISNGAGEANAVIETPTVVSSLADYKITEIQGGNHHSIACTEDHKTLVWGRCDDSQAGIPLDEIPKEDLVFNEQGKPRILSKPTVLPGIAAISVAAGIDNSLAITTEGTVYSWGFSSNYRTGLGTQDTIEEPTKLENTALLGKKLSFVACGGQFSVLAGPAPLTNGH